MYSSKQCAYIFCVITANYLRRKYNYNGTIVSEQLQKLRITYCFTKLLLLICCVATQSIAASLLILRSVHSLFFMMGRRHNTVVHISTMRLVEKVLPTLCNIVKNLCIILLWTICCYRKFCWWMYSRRFTWDGAFKNGLH